MNNIEIKYIDSVIVKNIGQELLIPKQIELYKSIEEGSLDISFLNSNSYKIYTHINVSCGTCIGAINQWQELDSLVFGKLEVPVIAFCSSEDDFELFKYLCETGSIKNLNNPFGLDLNNKYIHDNNFMSSVSNLETVLTDSLNQIILIGNPLLSRKIEKLYLNKITN